MEVEVLQVRGKSGLMFISGHNHALPFAKGEGNAVMQATVTPQQRQPAKREIVRQMKQGASTHEARVRSSVLMHRTTVYRLLKRVQSEGESELAGNLDVNLTQVGFHQAEGLLNEVVEQVDRGQLVDADDGEELFEARRKVGWRHLLRDNYRGYSLSRWWIIQSSLLLA
jgi:hypothetical protein